MVVAVQITTRIPVKSFVWIVAQPGRIKNNKLFIINQAVAVEDKSFF